MPRAALRIREKVCEPREGTEDLERVYSTFPSSVVSGLSSMICLESLMLFS